MGGRRMILPQDRGHLELTAQGRVLENGEPDLLYRNDGRGHFTPVSWTDGTFLDEAGHPLREAPLDWGLTAAFRDLNGDGLPDLYVCNDFHSPDRIWINDGHGHFRAIPQLAIRHTPTFSMAVDFADVGRDGRDDILVSDMMSRDHGRRLMQIAAMAPYTITVGDFADRPQLDRTCLQWNRGDGTYAEIAAYAGSGQLRMELVDPLPGCGPRWLRGRARQHRSHVRHPGWRCPGAHRRQWTLSPLEGSCGNCSCCHRSGRRNWPSAIAAT